LPVYCLVTTKVRADHVVPVDDCTRGGLAMDRVVRFFRIVLAIPAAVLFVATGNHIHGL
jgi:hypothetical protein